MIVVARIKRNFCQYRMWTRMYSSTGVPMSDHHGRKDSKQLVSRESREKALLGMVAGGCGRDCSGRLVFVGFCRHGM